MSNLAMHGNDIKWIGPRNATMPFLEFLRAMSAHLDGSAPLPEIYGPHRYHGAPSARTRWRWFNRDHMERKQERKRRNRRAGR